MKNLFIGVFLLVVLAVSPVRAQELYFPPLTGSTWETVTPASLGWCESKIDSLADFLEGQNTKAFIVLKGGKIAIERYFDAFTRDSLWYWASAGKTLTAFTVGLAQEDGYLSIQDTTADYLGTGWTAAPPAKEAAITVWHQLTMTSGLDDGVANPYCTLDTCLTYLADAGTRWAYHNGPYTLLDAVITQATGQSLNQYITTKIKSKTGMTGLFVQVDDNNVYFSTARSMARFGLLMLNKGKWGNTTVMADTAYFRQMITQSQSLNPSYGYLWWLNGYNGYMVPGLQVVLPGYLCPDAPADMYAAMGKNGQFIDVVPSQDLVLIRMGNAPDNSLVPFLLNNQIWQYFNEVTCSATPVTPRIGEVPLTLYPNPARDQITLETSARLFSVSVYNMQGQAVLEAAGDNVLNISQLSPGMYSLHAVTSEGTVIRRFVRD
ncbi:MAG: serine hydrolase [Bacteroidia bacterium]|nr:serine hydrolase [Bacteroidia bacterium]